MMKPATTTVNLRGSQVVYLQTAQTWANAGVILLSRICEFTTGYTFTPCGGSFTSPGRHQTEGTTGF